MTEQTPRIKTEDFIKPCSCRSDGECSHSAMAPFHALNALVDGFGRAIKSKLYTKLMEGRSGWDDPEWGIAQIRQSLIEHIDKGDPVDIAAFAAFWWNRITPKNAAPAPEKPGSEVA